MQRRDGTRRNGRRARRKAVIPVRCWPSLLALRVDVLDAADLSGCPVRTLRGRCIVTARTSSRPGRCWPRFVVGSSSAVWRFTRRRRDCLLQGRQPARQYEHVSFDFLGFTFQPRTRARIAGGRISLPPAGDEYQGRETHSAHHPRMAVGVHKNHFAWRLARIVDPVVRGDELLRPVLPNEVCSDTQHLNEALAAWVRRKHKRFRYRRRASRQWLRCIARRDPKLFALWSLRETVRLKGKSRMRRECSRPVL